MRWKKYKNIIDQQIGESNFKNNSKKKQPEVERDPKKIEKYQIRFRNISSSYWKEEPIIFFWKGEFIYQTGKLTIHQKDFNKTRAEYNIPVFSYKTFVLLLRHFLASLIDIENPKKVKSFLKTKETWPLHLLKERGCDINKELNDSEFYGFFEKFLRKTRFDRLFYGLTKEQKIRLERKRELTRKLFVFEDEVREDLFKWLKDERIKYWRKNRKIQSKEKWKQDAAEFHPGLVKIKKDILEVNRKDMKTNSSFANALKEYRMAFYESLLTYERNFKGKYKPLRVFWQNDKPLEVYETFKNRLMIFSNGKNRNVSNDYISFRFLLLAVDILYAVYVGVDELPKSRVIELGYYYNNLDEFKEDFEYFMIFCEVYLFKSLGLNAKDTFLSIFCKKEKVGIYRTKYVWRPEELLYSYKYLFENYLEDIYNYEFVTYKVNILLGTNRLTTFGKIVQLLLVNFGPKFEVDAFLWLGFYHGAGFYSLLYNYKKGMGSKKFKRSSDNF